ncbi:MAG: surface carbohydrate biosynthesis protein [Bacillota bacterium]
MTRTGEPASVALVVDHPQRDLAGLVLTALDLCRRGIAVHLVPLNLQAHELWSLGPDLVVLNYVRPGNDRLARQLLEAGIRVGVLDTEGGAWEDCHAYSELFWRDRALLRQLSFACMWGPRLAQHVVSEGLLDPEQVVVTGCPRFDFYSPRWRAVFAGGDEPRSLILINTSFSYGNPRFASPERNRERLQRELGLGAERVEAYLAAERRAVDGMVELARSLSADVPECQVVLRPHPFEDPAAYQNALRGCPGVSVDTTGPVQPWIFRSAAVVQRSCSTAIEAALAGVPALSPQWIQAPAVVPVAESVSVPCATYEELRLRVRSILAPNGGTEPAPRAPQPVLNEWFHHCDGLAHSRVGDTVAAHLPARRSVDARQCRQRLYGLADESAGLQRRLGARLRYHLRISPDQSFRPGQQSAADAWDRSDKRFGADDVTAVVSAIHAATNAQGRAAEPVTVAPARAERWAGRFRCRSVTISPAG